MTGRIHQVSISPGGVPKLPVPSARVTRLGLEGDAHDDVENHGGPDRALCVYSLEVIEEIRAEGHPLAPGSAGENVTIAGLEWSLVKPATRLRLGDDVEIEITRYTTPCATNARWFLEGDFTRMLQSRHPGSSRVYAAVRRTGEIRTGDRVVVLPPERL